MRHTLDMDHLTLVAALLLAIATGVGVHADGTRDALAWRVGRDCLWLMQSALAVAWSRWKRHLQLAGLQPDASGTIDWTALPLTWCWPHPSHS